MLRSVCHPEIGPLPGGAEQTGVRFPSPLASKDLIETIEVSSGMRKQAQMA